MNPDTPVRSVEREVRREIMNTDIYVKIVGRPEEQKLLTVHLEEIFLFFRDFEQRFSRFRNNSELSQFNQSGGGIVSSDLFSILQRAQTYCTQTAGIFDPAILPALESIGYPSTSSTETITRSSKHSILELVFDPIRSSVTKPESLKIDLGGIGKGYAVDMATKRLRTWGHRDFVVDAGGDIFASGINREDQYPYWAFDIENPFEPDQSVTTVLLSNEAIATSGRNRRTWTKNNITKHHLIDPATLDSASMELMTVSVIAPDTTSADVWAKTFFILGLDQGLALAEQMTLPALFITHNQQVISSSTWQQKTWLPTSQPTLKQVD